MVWDVGRIFFWFVASALLVCATLVVTGRRPVLSVVSLISCFVLGAILWLMVGAEFLSLGLIFVYVGAVMTLFLFVVMMLNQESVQIISRRLIVWPLSAVTFALMSYMILHKLIGADMVHDHVMYPVLDARPNVEAIGQVLYTQYVLSFEVAAVILLVAMVAAITLTFRGAMPGSKTQKIREQVRASKADRLSLVDLKKGEGHAATD